LGFKIPEIGYGCESLRAARLKGDLFLLEAANRIQPGGFFLANRSTPGERAWPGGPRAGGKKNGLFRRLRGRRGGRGRENRVRAAESADFGAELGRSKTNGVFSILPESWAPSALRARGSRGKNSRSSLRACGRLAAFEFFEGWRRDCKTHAVRAG